MIDSIPKALEALTRFEQFVIWDKFPKGDKIIKVTLNPQTLKKSDAHSPDIWMSYENAAKAARKHSKYVGFVITNKDPFFFLDVDDCIVDGQWSPIASELLSTYSGAAVELSQSYGGLHIIGSTKRHIVHGKKKSKRGFDLYTDKRFIALTGFTPFTGADEMPGDSSTVFDPTALEIEFKKEVPEESPAWSDGPVPEWSGPENDDELIQKMMKAVSFKGLMGGASLHDLWTGNEDKLCISYPPDPNGNLIFDHSSADQALCNHLAFWTGKDCARIERLFSQSALVRDKWTDRAEYRESTILNAVSLNTKVYRDRAPAPPPGSTPGASASGWNVKTVYDQMEEWKGFVYVKSLHRVFIPGSADLLKPEVFRIVYGGAEFSLDASNFKMTKNAWDAYSGNHAFRPTMVDRVCFRPDLPEGEIVNVEGSFLVNTYRSILTSVRKGNPLPFLRHLELLLPDDRDRRILLSYLATLVQHKGRKVRWCPVLIGCEGNGKTVFIRCIEHAIGLAYTHLPDARDIDNKFNAWLSGKLFIGVEEIHAGGRVDISEALKPMITNPRGPIQAKGVDQVTQDNYANFICCSNHEDAVIKTKNDRRYAIMLTAQSQASDINRDGMGGAYFPNLYSWLEKEGYEIVNYYLQNYKIEEEFNPLTLCHRAPDTSGMAVAIKASMSPAEQEVYEAVQSERIGFKGGFISSYRLTELFSENRLKIPKQKYTRILRELGFSPHKALANGRTNRLIPQEDRTKIRIYTQEGADEYKTPEEVTAAYLDKNYEN